MTPLEMIAELCPLRSHATAKGCADASPDNLEACPACAVAFIDILERKLMRDTNELQRELEYERKLRQEAQEALIAMCRDEQRKQF